jgi:bromodomain-containing protein 7/9
MTNLISQSALVVVLVVLGNQCDHSSETTPILDKKSLELILDKLQKKDIYGVYAEPVDPEELPDYHDMIEHPMDFSTVRKKLANGSYSTLEELESDVLLICSNAMQYNSSDTVYYKQVNHVFIFSPIFFLC